MSRDLIWIFLAMLTWGFGEGMFYSFEPLYLQQLGADALKIGSILGLVGLAMTLAFLPAGYLSDRIGRRPLLRLSWVTGLLSTLLMAFAPSLPIFIVGMVLYGSTAYVTVPLYSYITTARGRWSVGRVLTLNSAAYNLGNILGPIIGGLIGAQIGLKANFRFAALVFIVSTGLIFLIKPQPVEKRIEAEPAPGWRDLLKGDYLRYLILIFFIMFGMYLPWPLSQNFLLNERGIGIAVIGQLVAARSVGAVILNLSLGHLNPRLGLVLAQLFSGIFTIIIWYGNGLPWYMIAYMLMGSLVAGRGLIIAQGRSLVQSANMGIAYGMLETAMAFATVLGPPLAGYLYNIDPAAVYMVSLALICAGLLANLFLSPIRQKDLVKFEEKERKAWTQS